MLLGREGETDGLIGPFPSPERESIKRSFLFMVKRSILFVVFIVKVFPLYSQSVSFIYLFFKVRDDFAICVMPGEGNRKLDEAFLPCFFSFVSSSQF